MKRVILTAVGLVALISLDAQNITGKIVDEQGEPMGFANIVALTLPDSAFVSGTISLEDGTFAFDVEEKAQLLRFTSIGYDTYYAPRKSDMGTVN